MFLKKTGAASTLCCYPSLLLSCICQKKARVWSMLLEVEDSKLNYSDGQKTRSKVA